MRKPTALLRRIEALEQKRGATANRPLVPRLMSCDEWEALAVERQQCPGALSYELSGYGSITSSLVLSTDSSKAFNASSFIQRLKPRR